MGFFFQEHGDYKVVKLVGWFGGEQTVLENVTLEEAQDYVDSRSGWLGDGYEYKIVKVWDY